MEVLQGQSLNRLGKASEHKFKKHWCMQKPLLDKWNLYHNPPPPYKNYTANLTAELHSNIQHMIYCKHDSNNHNFIEHLLYKKLNITFVICFLAWSTWLFNQVTNRYNYLNVSSLPIPFYLKLVKIKNDGSISLKDVLKWQRIILDILRTSEQEGYDERRNWLKFVGPQISRHLKLYLPFLMTYIL